MRELVLGNTRFNDIARALPGISRSLLVQRLRHLERSGVLETWPSPTGHGSQYSLTPAGRDLERVIDSLARWAIEWLYEDMEPHDVEATTLMWWMHRRADPARFLPHRTVVEWHHTAPLAETIWYVLEHGAGSVCTQHPGFEVDLVVTMSTGDLADVFQGIRGWRESVDSGAIRVVGPPRLAAALPTWFAWSPWADATHARALRSVSA